VQAPKETIMYRKIFAVILVCACMSGGGVASAAEPSSKEIFSVAHRHVLGGEGGWDLLAVDAKRHHIFITRSTHVQVADTNSGKLVGDIPRLDGVHGIAIAEDLNVGFTSNGKTNSVSVFNLDTFKVVAQIKISGVNPDAILYDPKSRHVFVFNGQSANGTVIDAVSRKELATIDLPGKPELAVSNNAGRIFVNIEDKNEIAVIDSGTNKLVQRYPLGSGTEPTGLAIDIAHNRLFAVCGNRKMEILDAENGRVVAEIEIGAKPDSAAFDAGLGMVFSSNGDGTLTIVKEDDPDHFSVVQNLVTQKGARTMAYDASIHRAYLVTAQFGESPAATKDRPKPRPTIVPGTFELLVVALGK
jgi:WD40 repeat protein